MNLTVLGSSNWELAVDRHPACFLIESGDHRLLFDCGYGAYHNLAAHGIDPRQLTGIFVSHCQPDHMTDLLPIVHARLLLEMRDAQEHVPLLIVGPPGIQKRWRDLHEIFCSTDLLKDDVVHVGEMKDSKVFIGDFTVYPFRVRHLPKEVCLGFRVEIGGRSVAYAADVGGPIDEQETTFINSTHGVNVLIIEAGATRESRYHLTLDEAIQFGKQQAKDTILINHVPAEALQNALAREDSSKPFVRIARDGMTMVV